MAVRRRYKDGGRVVADAATIEVPEEPSADVSTAPPASPGASHAADDDADAVIRAMKATARAEELQKQAQRPPQSIDEVIDRLPLSERRKAVLRQNQFLLDPQNQAAVQFYHRQSVDLGNAPDSDEEDQHILRGVIASMKERHERGIHDARRATTEMLSPPIDSELVNERAVEHLNNEADAIRATMHAAGAVPTEIASDVNIAPVPASRPSPQRGPITAPVSREVPTASGKRSNHEKITLSAEQRDLARRSMSWLSPQEAERTYAINLQRMLAMRANGTLNE